MEVRDLKISELDKLIGFLKENKPDHIFCRDPDSIIYYHLNKETKLTINCSTYFNENQIIKAVQFYEPIGQNNSEWGYGCLFLAAKDAPLGSGLLIFKNVLSKLKKGFISTGNNPKMRAYHKRLAIKTTQMTQYVLVNLLSKNSSIISFKHGYVEMKRTRSQRNLIYRKVNSTNINNIKNVYSDNFNSYCNKKPFDIFTDKYLVNPYYEYTIILITQPSLGLLVFRRITYKESSIIKLVEYYSDVLDLDLVAEISEIEFFRDLSCEAVSFYCYTNRQINEGRFIKIGCNGTPICCPNHFKPFRNEYIQLFCSFNFDSESILITSGDADQDRAS